MSGILAVVLNYRTADKTLVCLRSLVAEGVSHIVLVENSADHGISLKQMYTDLEALRCQGVMVEVLDQGRNLGFAAGVNCALSHIKTRSLVGDVLLINSDARLELGALARLVEAIRGGAEMAAPMILSPNQVLGSPLTYYQKYFGIVGKHRILGSLPFIVGACILLNQNFVNPDLFDEDFFFYGEDVMLGAAMSREGKRFLVVKSALVIHEGSGSAHNGSIFYEYHINRSHWVLAQKLSTGYVDRVFFVLGRMAVLPLRAIVRCVRIGSFKPAQGFLQATLDALFGK